MQRTTMVNVPAIHRHNSSHPPRKGIMHKIHRRPEGGAGTQLSRRSFTETMLKLGTETHLTCTSPGFSGLYKDRLSTCSGTSLYPYPGISSQCCRTYKALCSSSTKFSSATSLLFLTEASAGGHSQGEDEGFWPARVMSGHKSLAQVTGDGGLGKQAPLQKTNGERQVGKDEESEFNALQ